MGVGPALPTGRPGDLSEESPELLVAVGQCLVTGRRTNLPVNTVKIFGIITAEPSVAAASDPCASSPRSSLQTVPQAAAPPPDLTGTPLRPQRPSCSPQRPSAVGFPGDFSARVCQRRRGQPKPQVSRITLGCPSVHVSTLRLASIRTCVQGTTCSSACAGAGGDQHTPVPPDA